MMFWCHETHFSKLNYFLSTRLFLLSPLPSNINNIRSRLRAKMDRQCTPQQRRSAVERLNAPSQHEIDNTLSAFGFASSPHSNQSNQLAVQNSQTTSGRQHIQSRLDASGHQGPSYPSSTNVLQQGNSGQPYNAVSTNQKG